MNLAILVPLFPLLGFLINGIFRKQLSKSVVGVIGGGVIFISFLISCYLFGWVYTSASSASFNSVVFYFDFINVAGIKLPFAFQIDQLSSIFLLIITGIGTLIHIYSTAYMHDEPSEHFARYFAYLNLFVFSMLLLVMGANYLIMFIGWEGVGLCSYLLIGFWFKDVQNSKAARKAFVMNRIGDFGFLLAMFWILLKVGSLDYTVVLNNPLQYFSITDILGITLLLFLGATGKSAQIPLYTWLPDAMAGPTPVSALIHAATMVTAGIYMVVRSNVLFVMAPLTLNIIAVVGLATAILAAMIALKQNDIKKILAYSTVSQLGYMFLALGVGAFTGAVFHVMTHAFFKACLFLGAGSVIHAMGGEQDIRKMGGLQSKMPITHITFLLACLAIAGMPPFAGFFSKDEILAHAFAASPLYWTVALLGALMTAFYMFRLYALTFKGAFRGTQEQAHHLHESPIAMTSALVILATLSVVGGFIGIPPVLAEGKHILNNFLTPIFAQSANLQEIHHVSHTTEWLLMGISTALVVLMVLWAWRKYTVKKVEEQPAIGFAKLLENKFYVDEIYQAVVVAPMDSFSKFLKNKIEKKVIDGAVNGAGKLVLYCSRQIRLLQSGRVASYLTVMIFAFVCLFLVFWYQAFIIGFLQKIFK